MSDAGGWKQSQQMQDGFAEADLDLTQYLKVIKRRKWSIVLFATLVTFVASLIVYSMVPVYKATATILIEPERQKSFSLESMIRFRSQAKEYYLTQLEILKSRHLAEKVIVDLNLANSADFVGVKEKPGYFLSSMTKWFALTPKSGIVNQQPDPATLMDGYILKIQGGMSVRLIPETQLIQVTYQSTSSKLAADIANGIVQAYISDLRSARAEVSRSSTAWMEHRLLVLKKNLQESDQLLQTYRERHGLIDVQGVGTLAEKELQEHTSRLLIARTKYKELSDVYGPRHPKLIAAQSEMVEAESSRARMEEKIHSIGRKAVRLRELQGNVDSYRKLYETFLNGLKEAAQSMELERVNARITDAAVTPRSPFKPNKRSIVMMVFFASLMFAVLLSFLYEALDKTFKSTGDLEERLNLPVLGLLPLVKGNRMNRKEQAFAMLDPKLTSFSEAMRTIRTGLVLSSLDNPHKVILVTSSVPGEGKTVVSCNLAIAMGQMERVLLIGADLRRPSLARVFGLHEEKLGVSSIVAGTHSFQDCIKHIDQIGIDVLASGVLPPNPLELLSSSRFSSMIAVLENHYDRIVIDSPPLQAVSDSLVLSKYAQSIVYVVEADSTHEKAVKSGVNRLLEYGAPITGIILNKFNIQEAGKYADGYSGYYDQYGYSEINS